MKNLILGALLVLMSANAMAVSQWTLIDSKMIDVSGSGLWECTYEEASSNYIQVLYKHNYCPYAVFM